MVEGETSHSDASGASSPGAILRRCRVYHGTTIEEAAEATKIDVHYLEALENDQISAFAHLTYLKGFLRIYTGYLGLNLDDLMPLYEHLDTQSNGHNDGNDSTGTSEKGLSWRKLLIPAVLLVLMVVASFILEHSSRPPPPLPPSQNEIVAASPMVAVQPALSSPQPTLQEKQEHDSAREQTVQKQISAEEGASGLLVSVDSFNGIVVRLKVVQNGWLSVSIDGSRSQHHELSSGDVFEWKADKTVALELSDAASVETSLNGKPLQPFGAAGSSAYVVLDANYDK